MCNSFVGYAHCTKSYIYPMYIYLDKIHSIKLKKLLKILNHSLSLILFSAEDWNHVSQRVVMVLKLRADASCKAVEMVLIRFPGLFFMHWLYGTGICLVFDQGLYETLYSTKPRVFLSLDYGRVEVWYFLRFKRILRTYVDHMTI